MRVPFSSRDYHLKILHSIFNQCEGCDFIVMSLCFSDSSKVECDISAVQICSTVNCCMRVLQRHRIYNYLGDYGGLEGPKCGLWGRVGQQAGTVDAAVQVQRL